jgi:hypothetical protein
LVPPVCDGRTVVCPVVTDAPVVVEVVVVVGATVAEMADPAS